MGDMIRLSDCELHKEYITKHGKKIQLVGKSNVRAKILVLASDTEITVPIHYKVFELMNQTEDAAPEEQQEDAVGLADGVEVTESEEFEVVRASDVISNAKVSGATPDPKPPKKALKKEPKKALKKESIKELKKKNKPKGITKKDKPNTIKNSKKGESRIMKKYTAKQLVWDMLKKHKKGVTKTKLAEEIIAKGMTENVEVKKVKNYVGLILSSLKKNGVNIISIEPGKYIIEND